MDINEIRQYNKEVQAYQSKASELLASKDYRKKELDKLCLELSNLTGQQVTQDNLETVYTQMMSQFQQTLNTGKEIIERAKAEEQALNTASTNAPTGTTMGGMQGGFATQQAPVQNQGMGQGFNGFGGFMTPGQMGGVDFNSYDSHGTVQQI